MRVLSIDPGYGRCGMAVLERSGVKDSLLFSTCVETPANTAFDERLRIIVGECERLVAEYQPAALAMERLYFNVNQKTAMQVAEVRGALLAVAAQHSLPVAEYTPGQVKSAAAGWGGADKEQVARMLRTLLGIRHAIKHDDEYDAIAVGVTHLAHARVHTAIVRSQ